MSETGHFRQIDPLPTLSACPLRSEPRALVITATASRSLAKLSGVPSTCPMLAVLTMASTWEAGAARLAGNAKSPATGVRPATLSFAAAASDRDKARTSWRLLRQLPCDGGTDKSGRARE